MSGGRVVPDVLAAVDLGSNSFHMVVARYSHGQLTIIDRLREMVRLASGVEENGRIDKEAAARALACLERFGQRLRDMHANSVRVVGTNTLRVARRKQAFLERAREALRVAEKQWPALPQWPPRARTRRYRPRREAFLQRRRPRFARQSHVRLPSRECRAGPFGRT